MITKLALNEVHTWCVRLDVSQDVSVPLVETLSPEERERSERFEFDRDRLRFVVAHGVLRDLLGRYLRMRPAEIRLIQNEFGKPELHPELRGGFRFNLSHSNDLALIAISADSKVGVDVEFLREGSDYADIAKWLFSPDESAELDRAPAGNYSRAFLGSWTKKEAYLKARGVGFANPWENRLPLIPETPWSIFELHPAPGYVGALAVEGAVRELRCFDWRLATA